MESGCGLFLPGVGCLPLDPAITNGKPVSRTEHVRHQRFLDGMRQYFLKHLIFMDQVREDEMANYTGASFKSCCWIGCNVKCDTATLLRNSQDCISKLLEPGVVESQCRLRDNGETDFIKLGDVPGETIRLYCLADVGRVVVFDLFTPALPPAFTAPSLVALERRRKLADSSADPAEDEVTFHPKP